MTKDKEAALLRDFPTACRGRIEGKPSIMSPFSVYGFEVGDGWEPLVRRTLEKLEPLGVMLSQVKEKFGGLRIYVTAPDGVFGDFKIVADAERESLSICEMCGTRDGVTTTGSWIKTFCPACRLKWDEGRRSGMRS